MTTKCDVEIAEVENPTFLQLKQKIRNILIMNGHNRSWVQNLQEQMYENKNLYKSMVQPNCCDTFSMVH
jgi:hypothetical protein